MNDYAQDIGAPVYHPHVSIIHYDEVGEIRHTLNRFNVYALFLQKEFPENLTYGIGTYIEGDGSLLAYAPGQIGGKSDDGTLRQYHGSYNSNEALFLTTEEKDILTGLMANIRAELSMHGQEEQSDNIVKDYIQLILDYCSRFYARQFKEQATTGSDILTRFQQVLIDYYAVDCRRQKAFLM